MKRNIFKSENNKTDKMGGLEQSLSAKSLEVAGLAVACWTAQFGARRAISSTLTREGREGGLLGGTPL